MHLTWGAWPMVVWKLVVKTWSLERKHRGGHTSAVPRELAQENVNVARIKICRRSSEQHQRGPAACKLPCSRDRNLDSRLARAQVDTHGLSRRTAVFAMSFLCQWEGEGLPWHWRVQTGILRSFQRLNPHLFRTQSHKALFVFDLVCRAGWTEVMLSHNTLSHRGGPPCCKQDLITYQRLQALSINWTQHG